MPFNTLILIIAILGAVLVVYSQLVEAEHRRDCIRMIGSLGVLVYAIVIWNPLFMALMAGIFLAALIEFIEILIGHHIHRPIDIKTDKAKDAP